MKLKIIFLLVFINFFLNKTFGIPFIEREKFKDFCVAINEVIVGFFLLRNVDVNIIIAEDDSSNEIVSKVLAERNEKYTSRIENVVGLKEAQRVDRKKFLVLVVVENFKSLMDLGESLSTKSFSANAYFLIVVLEEKSEKSEKAEKIFNWFWKKNFYNVNILMDIEDCLAMLTFYPFTEGKCQEPTVEIINTFNATSRRWENNLYYPKKFKNLYQCKFIFATINQFVIQTGNGGIRVAEYDLVETFGRILNFSSKCEIIDTSRQISKNGSGPMTANLLASKIHFAPATLQLERMQVLSGSYPFQSDPMVLIIPEGSPLTPLEKLYKTFDGYVWCSMFGVFVIVLILFKWVLNVKMTSTNTMLDLTNAFLGASILSHRLPVRHSSRFSLTIFMLYALIIRTAYVGILFQHIHSDVKHKEAADVDAMIDEDFTFYAYETLYVRLNNYKFYNRFDLIFLPSRILDQELKQCH